VFKQTVSYLVIEDCTLILQCFLQLHHLSYCNNVNVLYVENTNNTTVDSVLKKQIFWNLEDTSKAEFGISEFSA